MSGTFWPSNIERNTQAGGEVDTDLFGDEGVQPEGEGVDMTPAATGFNFGHFGRLGVAASSSPAR